MEAQSEHAHVACAFFARVVPILHSRSVLVGKISASELSRKLIKSGVVGWASVCGREDGRGEGEGGGES